jgi:3-dehydroquinate dehydratase/shikimate dehydrogenase
MGGYGTCTRILARRLGSYLCYSSAPGPQAAPGQVDPLSLTSLYRFKSIGKDSALFGVIGRPVSHSLSPLIHNRGFQALGMDAVYLPFLVDDAGEFLRAAETLGVRGLSVTVPHKEAVMPLLSRRDAEVEAIGACNTMLRAPGQSGWSGTNTDAEGFLAPLAAAFGGSVPRGLRATVIGAGGASRAVVHALAQSAADVLVLNRSPERARELGRDFSVSWGPLDEEGAELMRDHAELVVQATSVGMEPSVEADPLPRYRFTGRETVYDLVYRPPVSAFLARARAAGCRTIGGGSMLLAQGLAQFRLFAGVPYPPELAREMEELLSAGDPSGQNVPFVR